MEIWRYFNETTTMPKEGDNGDRQDSIYDLLPSAKHWKCLAAQTVERRDINEYTELADKDTDSLHGRYCSVPDGGLRTWAD